jgi:hypothetical protein
MVLRLDVVSASLCRCGLICTISYFERLEEIYPRFVSRENNAMCTAYITFIMFCLFGGKQNNVLSVLEKKYFSFTGEYVQPK